MAAFFNHSSMSRRRFLSTSVVTVSALAGAGTMLDACDTSASSSSGSSNGSATKTTLAVMYNPGELTPAHITEFQKLNPDIKINFLTYDQVRLNAMFAAGTPPDFVRAAGVTDSPNLAARGLALNLDSYLAKSSVLKVDDLSPVNNAWRWSGKQGEGSYYGITKDYSQDGMFWYNAKLFDQAKVPYPDKTTPLTYDQLLDYAGKLTTRQGSKILSYGLDAQWADPAHVIQMVLQQGGTVFSADFSKVDFTSAEARKVLQWYVHYGQAHVGPSPLDPNPDGWDGPPFLANRMAMAQYGFWFGGEISTATNDLPTHIGFAPAPVMGSQRVSDSFSAVGAWIPANAKNKDAAWRLMEYFMAGKPAHERAQSGWGLPALKSLQSEIPQAKPYQAQALQTQQNEAQYLTTLQFSPYIQVTAMQTVIDKYLQQAAKGQISVDGAAQQITDGINLLLQQGKQQIG
ncbi:MAG TPA: extracellular solute-binding protein [Ktedonosporobacter sp.]|nr:extracellular solute-binding protein [Ktedonosporobacter sp.]